MKNFYLYTLPIIFLATSFLPYKAHAQVSITPNGNPVCPGVDIEYQITGTPDGTYEWTVTNGTIPAYNSSTTGPENNLRKVKIRWNNVTNYGSITVKVNGTTYPLDFIIIKSVHQQTPSLINGNISKSQNIEWCYAGSSTFTIDRMQFPNTTAQNPVYVDKYEWELPHGWSFNGQVSGPGVTFTTTSYSISVNTTAGTTGKIRVRGYSETCNNAKATGVPASNYYSLWQELTITRNLENKITGPATVSCADLTNKTYSIPPVLGAGTTSYTWTLPVGWTDINGNPSPVTNQSNTITLKPNGSNAGNIQVSVRLTCTGTATDVSAAPFPIAFDPNLQIPTLTGLPQLLCKGGSKSVTASSPGATSYTWTTTGGLLINGSSSITTTSGQVTLSSPSTNNFRGTGVVHVKANNNSCSSSLNLSSILWVGPPAPPTIEGLNEGFCNGSRFYMQAKNLPVGYAADQKVTSYTWFVSGMRILGGQGTQTVHVEVTDDTWLYASASATNACGPGYYGEVSAFPMCLSSTEATTHIFPNPAYNFLDVAVGTESSTKEESISFEEESEITLLNQEGQVVRSAKTKNKKARLNVQTLPEGTYYLHISNKYGHSRKQIIVDRKR